MLMILFWILLLWRIVGGFTGMLSRKEGLCLDVMIDGVLLLGLLANAIVGDGFWQVASAIGLPFVVRWTIRDYRAWRDADDDDEPGQRRRAWVRSKIPRPTVAKIRPVQGAA